MRWGKVFSDLLRGFRRAEGRQIGFAEALTERPAQIERGNVYLCGQVLETQELFCRPQRFVVNIEQCDRVETNGDPSIADIPKQRSMRTRSTIQQAIANNERPTLENSSNLIADWEVKTALPRIGKGSEIGHVNP